MFVFSRILLCGKCKVQFRYTNAARRNHIDNRYAEPRRELAGIDDKPLLGSDIEHVGDDESWNATFEQLLR